MKKSKEFEIFLTEKLKISEFAWWDWHIPTNKVTFNDLKVTWLGYNPKDFIAKGYEAFTTLLHPDDYERSMEAMRRYLIGEENLYKIDYRIRDINGKYHWYIDRGYATELDKMGKPLELRGIVLDMGEFFSEEMKSDIMINLLRKVVPFTPKNNYITVCTVCKKLKISETQYVDYKGKLEDILNIDVSHSICPECVHRLYPDLEMD